ncbi:hypothetical protein RND71_025270 [Anisodus tanguticus]|uniref:Uncharacterized protein n=1 Tax=Anisodus tanguticus TaxID=243964 RepID=A0AAE1RS70_9SOLA|nr:hypothetical protein RND71_025270 [Anisodus tanguticus]
MSYTLSPCRYAQLIMRGFFFRFHDTSAEANAKSIGNSGIVIPVVSREISAIAQPLAEEPTKVASHITLYAYDNLQFRCFQLEPEQEFYATAASIRAHLIKQCSLGTNTITHSRNLQLVGFARVLVPSRLLKGFSTPRFNSFVAPIVLDPIFDSTASVQHITEVPKKKSSKTKSSKPPKSLSVGSKRKRASKAGGPSKSQDTDNSPEDVWMRKVTNTTTPVEGTPAEVREENVIKATEAISLPIETTTIHSTTPPVTEHVIIEDDDEATDKESLAKRPKTSTSTPPPSSQPTQNFEQKDFERLFEEARTSANPTEWANTSEFAHMFIPQKLTKSTRTQRNHASSRSKLMNVFSAPIMDPWKVRFATIFFPEDTNFLSWPVGVANYLRPLISESDREKMKNVSWQCLFNKEAQLYQVSDLPIIRVELDWVKGDYLQAMNDLELVTEENKIFDEENEKLIQDVEVLTQELEKQEEVRHYQAQQMEFLNTELDRLNAKIVAMDADRVTDLAALKIA